MWSSPVATGSPPVEESPGQASSAIVAVSSVLSSERQLVDGSLLMGGNKGGRPVKGPRRGRAAGKSGNRRDVGDQRRRAVDTKLLKSTDNTAEC